MHFSCSLPLDEHGPTQFDTFESIARMSQAMERAGIDATFVTDHPAPSSRWLAGGGHPTLDPFVALTVAAMAAPNLKVQTHILVLAYRNPFVVAKAAASLDALSNGRFIMGIGTGYLKPEYAAVGVSFEDRGEITDESIRIMQQAWTGEPVAFESPRFMARDVVIQPRPPKGDIPIWAGGNAKRAIRRAVELCDGWCPFPAQGIVTKTARTEELSTMEHLKERLDYAKNYAAEIGRTKPLQVCMGRLHGPGTMSPDDRGDAAEMLDAYAELAEAGVTWTTMSVPSPSVEAFCDNAQWFGEEVIAKVRPKAAA